MTFLGASFPQTEIGADAAAIRDWAVAVEEMGFDYILAYDHVLGARPGHPDLDVSRFHFTSQSMVHEPMMLLGYFAAITQRVELVTAIIILPQRQTRSWPSKQLRSTYSVEVACDLASDWGGTGSNSKRSARTSRRAVDGSKNRSRFFDCSGPRIW